MAQKLDTLFYDIEARTTGLDAGVAAAKKKIGELQGAEVAVPVTVDPAPVERGTRKVRKELSDTEKAAQKTTASLKDNFTELGDAFSKSALGVGLVTASVVGLGAGLLKVADDYQLVANRLKLVTGSSEEFGAAQAKLRDIADGSFQSVGATVDLYARLARSSKALGLEQGELFEVTEAVSQAVKLSGVSAQAAEAGLVQLGQAFASGTLRGDELRSVLEQLPRLAEAIATGMGVSVGELRKLGEEGRLTSEQVARAIGSQLETLKAESASVGPTLGQSLTVLKNAVVTYVSDTNDAAGATQKLGAVVNSVAENFDAIANVAVLAASVYAGKAIGPMIVKAQAFVVAEFERAAASLAAAGASGTAATAVTAEGVAIANTTRAATAGTVAMTGLSRAMGLLGGPIGVAVTLALVGIAAAVGKAREEKEKATKATNDYITSLGELSVAELKAERERIATKRSDAEAQMKAPGVRGNPQAVADVRDATGYLQLGEQLAIVDKRLATMTATASRAAGVVKNDFAKALEDAEERNRIFARSGETAAEAFTKAAGSFKDAAGQNRSFAEALRANDPAAKEHLKDITAIANADAAFEGSKKRATDAVNKAQQAQEKYNDTVKRLDDISRDIILKLDETTKKQEEQAKNLEEFRKAQTDRLALLDEELEAVQRGPVAYKQFIEVQGVLAAGQRAVNDAKRINNALTKEEINAIRALGEEEERRRLKVENAKKGPGAVGLPEKRDLDALANGIGNALGAAQGLAAAFGDVGRSVADAAGKAENLVSALNRSRNAGQFTKVGTDGKETRQDVGFLGALTGKAGAGGLLAAAGSTLGVVGAVVAVGQAFDVFGTKAKQRAKEIAEATKAFGEGLRAFEGRAFGSDSRAGSALENAAKEYTKLAEEARNALKGQSLDFGLSKLGSALNADRARIAADALFDINDALDSLAGNTTAAQLRRAEQERDERARGIVALRQSGVITDEQEAEALNKIRKIFELTESQIKAAAEEAATLARVEANSREFAARARLFGIEGAEYAKGLVKVLGDQFPALQGILDGLDVSTSAGLATLKDRAKAIFEALSADGLTEAEQKIVDALFNIIDAAEAAAPALETLADKVNTALGNVGRDNDILGGSARDQFGRLSNAASGLSPEIAGILASVDLSNAPGIDAAKTKLRDLYTTLLVDGISDTEAPIVDLIRSLLSGLSDVAADAKAEIEKEADDAKDARDKARERSSQIIDAFDLEGADAFEETLKGYGEGFKDLFGTFDVDTLDGVTGAKDALRELLTGIQNGTADLSAFGTMTRDEIIAALLDLDGNLDGLKDSALAAADATEALTVATGDFLFDLNQQFLDATGQGLEAVRLATEKWVDDMIAEATELGVATEETVKRIREIGRVRIQQATDRANQASTNTRTAPPTDENASVTAPTARDRAESNTLDGEITTQRVSAITAIEAMTLNNVLSSSLVEHRATRVATEQMVAILSALAGGALPSLVVPSLPPSAGGGSGAAGGMFTIVVNVQGPIVGQSASDAGRQLAEAALPFLNESLARAAGIEARLAGVPLS